MAKVKILCECGECVEDVKEDLIKAFQSRIDSKDKFADPLMEELVEEADSWYNYYYSRMFRELAEVLKESE